MNKKLLSEVRIKRIAEAFSGEDEFTVADVAEKLGLSVSQTNGSMMLGLETRAFFCTRRSRTYVWRVSPEWEQRMPQSKKSASENEREDIEAIRAEFTGRRFSRQDVVSLLGVSVSAARGRVLEGIRAGVFELVRRRSSQTGELYEVTGAAIPECRDGSQEQHARLNALWRPVRPARASL